MKKYVPDGYKFQTTKNVLGGEKGLARHSHGAHLLDQLEDKLYASRVANKSHLEVKQEVSQTLLNAQSPGLNKIKFIREQVKEIEKEEAYRKE